MPKAKETNSIVVRESSYSAKKRAEIYGKYKIFCLCGYEGETKENYFCPSCNKKAEVVLDEKNNFNDFRLINSSFSHGRKLIAFKSVIRMYERFNKRFDKLTVRTKDEYFNAKFNLEKGTLEGNWFGNKGDFHRHVFFNNWYLPLQVPHSTLLELYNHNEHLKKFIDTVTNIRNISPILFSKLIEEKRFYKIFTLIKYPALQYTPWKEINTSVKNHCFLSKLTDEQNFEDVCHTLFGHHSKKFRNALSNLDLHDFFMVFGPYIKNTDVLLNFTELIKKTKQDAKLPLETNMYEIDYIKSGAELLSNLYEDKVWLTQLSKMFFKQEHRRYSELNEFTHYVADIGRLKEQVLSLKEDYEFKKTRYIEDFHNNLSKDITKLAYENQIIKYTKAEQELEKSIGGLDIVLAKNTHELVDIGKEMRICVGGYSNEALSKRCTILTIKDKNKYKVCLELRNNSLRQAKMDYNHRPDSSLNKIIVDWAKEKNIDYKECWDIRC